MDLSTATEIAAAAFKHNDDSDDDASSESVWFPVGEPLPDQLLLAGTSNTTAITDASDMPRIVASDKHTVGRITAANIASLSHFPSQPPPPPPSAVVIQRISQPKPPMNDYDGDGSSDANGSGSSSSSSGNDSFRETQLVRAGSSSVSSVRSDATSASEKKTADDDMPGLGDAKNQQQSADNSHKLVVKRKSHRKSKTGCITCRQRRVKCDEQLPICANCVKHRVSCDYENLSSESLRDRYLAQLVDRVMTNILRQTVGRTRPFAVLRTLQNLSNTDVRLLQHVSQLATRFVAVRPEHQLIWKEVGVQSAQREPFLLHAFLALASAHAGYLARSPDLFRVALEHKMHALRGAQQALAVFTPESSETVLAASILLSWQSLYTEDRDPSGGSQFASLAQGISTVLTAMGAWRDESPLATLYYRTLNMDNWPPPLPVSDIATPYAVLFNLRQNIARLQPLCLDSVTPARRFCLSALLRQLDAFLPIVNGGLINTLSLEELITRTEPFSRWQKCFVPSEVHSASTLFGFHSDESTPISDFVLQAYAADPVTRLVFAYFYATGLLIDGLWPPSRRSSSVVVRLGPLESILWGLRGRREWWMSVSGYAHFAERVVSCYKLHSWMPVEDTGALLELPERVVEVLWYGLMESASLNTFRL
ncbi:uncharacterized protein V1518DRAFT_281649 [Limtongia smithiae]|uniref:uncharacterized protein n=1 Tax=Limtongia smithiae TaxID=1125753 RepID=UPI0034CD1B1D